MRSLLKAAVDPGELVLDFFAGAATTAQAVMELNEEDGGDTSGTVKWWLRNRENTKWATRIVLPTGRRFFPDFVVGVTNRSTPDSIALVEIKDDGMTGRLQADANLMKIRDQHEEYKNVFWTYRADQGLWARGRYDDGLNRIVPQGAFKIAEMVYLT
jgi:type III restriction enzyme